jgi:hypothetical protein
VKLREGLRAVRDVSLKVSRIVCAGIFCSELKVHLALIDQFLKVDNRSYRFADIIKGTTTVSMKGSPRKVVSRHDMVVETKVCFNGRKFEFVGEKSNLLLTGDLQIKVKHRSTIVAVASDGKWSVIADCDSSLSVYKGKELQFALPVFTSLGKCLAISEKWQLVVCGTRDRTLMFCSLNRGCVTRIVQLENRVPAMVIVTRAWGFVLVYLRHFAEKEGMMHLLRLFTINGDLVGQVQVESAVVAWSTFATDDGFDWIAMALEDGGCYVFEAFYLKVGMKIHTKKVRIVGIAFVRELGAGVVATEDGEVTFFPWTL